MFGRGEAGEGISAEGQEESGASGGWYPPATEKKSEGEPDEDLAKNWDVYENKTLGFSIKYPPTYIAEEDKDAAMTPERGNVLFREAASEEGTWKLLISKNVTVGWVCVEIISSENIIVDGEEAELVVYSYLLSDCQTVNPEGARSAVVVMDMDLGTEEELRNWFFRFQIDKSKESEELSLFKTMLSTFRRL